MDINTILSIKDKDDVYYISAMKHAEDIIEANWD